MAEPFLKYRTRFTSSMKNELVPLFNDLTRQTRIPKSRLLDDAIEDLLRKYGIDPEKEKEHSAELCILFVFLKHKSVQNAEASPV